LGTQRENWKFFGSLVKKKNLATGRGILQVSEHDDGKTRRKIAQLEKVWEKETILADDEPSL